MFWAISCELYYRYQNPHQVERLTTWWPDFSHDIRCHNSDNWPQRNGNKWILELKITISKTTSMMLVIPSMPIWRWLSEMTAVLRILPSPFTSVYKSSCPIGCQWGQSAFGQMSTTPTASCQNLKKSKLCFLQTWPIYWLLSSKQPYLTYLLVTLSGGDTLLMTNNSISSIC